MPAGDLLTVLLANGVPVSGNGSVSTIDNLMGANSTYAGNTVFDIVTELTSVIAAVNGANTNIVAGLISVNTTTEAVVTAINAQTPTLTSDLTSVNTTVNAVVTAVNSANSNIVAGLTSVNTTVEAVVTELAVVNTTVNSVVTAVNGANSNIVAALASVNTTVNAVTTAVNSANSNIVAGLVSVNTTVEAVSAGIGVLNSTTNTINTTLKSIIGTTASPSANVLTVQGPSIAPSVSSSSGAAIVVKASAGVVLGAYAVNLTQIGGWLLLLNNSSQPADGAVTPLAVAPLPPGGMATIEASRLAALTFSTGIVAALSSAATPFTLTTSGGLAGFISCQAI